MDPISISRNTVMASFESAEKNNYNNFYRKKDVNATSQYIYPNQIEDANNIVNKFYYKNRRVISVQKKTKVGADGLILQIAKLFTTHMDDNFVIYPENVRIITGMSNKKWEEDMITKAPIGFKEIIFHHGQLGKVNLENITNSLIIIDEIDTGDREGLKLHKVLRNAQLLDVENMINNNNRFIFISATIIRELHDLYKWGELHEVYKMTIPPSYIGHKDFLDKGIIQNFYPLNAEEYAEKWIQEDILDNYKNDYRIHIVRVKEKNVNIIKTACEKKGVLFKNDNSVDRLSDDDKQLFEIPSLNQHIVIAIKNFYRRANLIPNKWKLRIGATHELYSKKIDYSVQIQGLPGRMTGYWRDKIDEGHKTGPYRTSIEAIEQYEKNYLDPFGMENYQTSGFSKKNGKVTASSTMLSVKNIKNLIPIDLTNEENIFDYRIYSDEDVVKEVCKILKYSYRPIPENEEGFRMTSLNRKKDIASLQEAINKVESGYGKNKGKTSFRTYYPCYLDKNNKETLRFVVIIRPDTDKESLQKCDIDYPSIPL